MRVTILPKAIILTKAHGAMVSMMAKGLIVARVLPLRCWLFFYPTIPYFFYLHYCERGYFRVYKCSRISEKWQFRVDLFSRFYLYNCLYVAYIFSRIFDKRE